MGVSPGQQIDRYKVVKLIASGGMGAVYEVENEAIGQRYAMKVLTLAADPGIVARFLNEARAVNAIRHPNIPQVYDFGALLEGTPFLVMEFLDGLTLDARLAAQRRLPLDETLEIAADIASAIAAAHEKGIVHRDLKPGNIMQVRDPEKRFGWRSKVLDFGIAKLASENLTKSKIALGTPTHMAPEQMEDASSVDGRADIYPLGIMLYQCLAGRLPYEWEAKRGTFALMLAKESPFAPLRRYAPEVPAELSDFIMRMMSRDRAARPLIGEVEGVLARAQGLPPRSGAAAPAPIMKITGAVVTVGRPAAQAGPAQDSDDLDPTTSALMDGGAPAPGGLVDLPSLSGSLVQPAMGTPSEQAARGEISPGKEAPLIVIPASISDVPSMPMALPPLKASPEDRTAQPAPTQGIPLSLALPNAPTAPVPPPEVAEPAALRGASASKRSPASLQWLFALLGAVGALGLAATLAVLYWPKPAPRPAPTQKETSATASRPAAATLLALSAVPPPAPRVPPEGPFPTPATAMKPAAMASAPPLGTTANGATAAQLAPSKPQDDATGKTPKQSRDCEPVAPSTACVFTPSLTDGQRDLLLRAFQQTDTRFCVGETLRISGLPLSPQISQSPASLRKDTASALTLTLRGMLRAVGFPNSVRIKCSRP